MICHKIIHSLFQFFYNYACLSEPDVVHYGSHFRPVIQSSGPWLCMKFISRESFSHRTSHMGFSAEYWFTTGKGSYH